MFKRFHGSTFLAYLLGAYSFVLQHPEQVNTNFTPFILLMLRPTIRLPSPFLRLTGNLTASDGYSDGSDFCKSLKSRNVDGLTGKTTPGSPSTSAVTAALLLPCSPTQS